MTDASIVDGDTCGVRHKDVPKLVNVELYMKKVSGVQEKFLREILELSLFSQRLPFLPLFLCPMSWQLRGICCRNFNFRGWQS